MNRSVTYLDFKEIFETEVLSLFGKEKSDEISSKLNWNDLLFKPEFSELTKIYNFGISFI